MNFDWMALALPEVAWIAIAFALGMLARFFRLPAMIGFLAAGFLLGAKGIEPGEFMLKISDLGVTLLLFTIGLKLKLRTLARPEVWAVASVHLVVLSLLMAGVLLALAFTGLTAIRELNPHTALLVGFALSFSSTVFVVKVLEDRGEMASLHGRTAIGILIVQDIAAVAFIAFSTATLPSPWMILVLLALLPLRPLLMRLLGRVGHGELLVLFGMVVAMGGAELFESVGIKGDVGALALGVMLAPHKKADELNKAMMGFKDLFLLGFFLSVGMSGSPSLSGLLVAVLLVPLALFKSVAFFFLFTRFRLRARTSLLASIYLGNYSEFGLIVASLAAVQGWISFDWLIIIAIVLSLSFVLAAFINRHSYVLHDRYRDRLALWQSPHRLEFDGAIDIGSARFLVVGMGGVGEGAYRSVEALHPGQVLGVDSDLDKVEATARQGLNVIRCRFLGAGQCRSLRGTGHAGAAAGLYLERRDHRSSPDRLYGPHCGHRALPRRSQCSRAGGGRRGVQHLQPGGSGIRGSCAWRGGSRWLIRVFRL